MTIAINKQLGKKPKGWDQSVIFFANILGLFFGNEQEAQVLTREVGSLESYGSRLIPLINFIYNSERNVLVLERKPDEDLIKYFCTDLGLTIPTIEVIHHELYSSFAHVNSELNSTQADLIRLFKDTGSELIDGYVTDTALTQISRLIGQKTNSTEEGSRQGNNKVLLHQFLLQSNLPVFDTVIVHRKSDVKSALNYLKKRNYRKAVIKSSIGASGIGMVKIDLNATDYEFPDYLFFEENCLVQGWLDQTVDHVEYIGSPSVQMLIKDEEVQINDLTDQILSDASVHEGNISMPAYICSDQVLLEGLLEQARMAGQWLHQKGYRGACSVDFHIIDRKGSIEIRICEINARVTGATYPSVLARNFLPDDYWMLRNIRFNPHLSGSKILSVLQEKKLLFVPKKTSGIIPINFNPNDRNEIVKGQFLFMGETMDMINRIVADLVRDPLLKGAFDRD